MEYYSFLVLILVAFIIGYFSRLYLENKYNRKREKEERRYNNIPLLKNNEALSLGIKIVFLVFFFLILVLISFGNLSPVFTLIPLLMILMMELVDGWAEYQSNKKIEQCIVNKSQEVIIVFVLIAFFPISTLVY